MNNANHPNSAQCRHALRLRPLALALYYVSLISFPGTVSAQVVVAGGNTKAYTAPNGVPVVDIATPNGAGLSHNVFNDFNVGRNGLVLNNGDTGQIARQSQLAGQVSANLNLNNAARVILNEVTSGNRSTLAGYTEVLGARADVVIANQYGITCSGCGFINTPHVTLTTGMPTIDADGNLASLRVRRGDILVSGTGLNGGGVDYLDLVARSVRVEAPVNGADLSVVSGANDWNHATRDAIAVAAPAGDAPAYGIDTSALGGMYANRIRLLATEQGMGVRLLGDAAASAAELTLSAQGQIEVRSRLSAQAGSIAVTGTGASGAIVVAGPGTGISAGQDVRLATQSAGIRLDDALLNAGRDLQVRSGATLTDAASAGNAGATRFAGNALSVAAEGAATIDGTSWGAGAGLDMRAGTLAVGSGGATLYGGGNPSSALHDIGVATASGDLDLGAARVVTPGAIGLAAAVTLALGNGGRLEAGSDVALSAGTRIANAGTALAVEDMTVRAGAIDNHGLLQAGAGLALEAQGDIANAAGAAMLAGAGLALRGASLSNDGVVQATGALAASVDRSLANGGKLLATGDLAVRGTGAGFKVANRNLIQAGGRLAIGAEGQVADLDNSVAGSLVGDSALFVLGELSNEGTVQGEHGVAIATDGDLVNGGSALIVARGADAAVHLRAGGQLRNGGTVSTQAGAIDLDAARIENSGIVGASGDLDLAAGSALVNSGTLQSTGPLSIRVGALLDNTATGKLLSTGDVTIGSSDSAFTVENRNRIQAGGALRVGQGGGRADLHNHAGARMLGDTAALALGAFDNDGTLQARGALAAEAGGALTNGVDAVIATTGGGNVDLHAADGLTNAGSIESSGALALTTPAALGNTGSIVTRDSDTGGANGALTMQAGALHNAGTVGSAGTAMVRAGSLVNTGLLQSQGALGAEVAESLDNGGTLLSADAVRLGSGTSMFSVANSGRIQGAGDLAIGTAGHLADLVNTESGLLLGADVTLAMQAFANDGIVQAGRAMRADAAGTLNNRATGQVLTQGGTLALAAGGNLNNAGAIESKRTLSLFTAGLLGNSGSMQSLGGPLDLHAAGVVNTASGFVRSAAALTLGTGTSLDNGGRLVAAGTLRISGDAASFTVVNAGRMQAGSTLSLGDADHAAALTNRKDGVLLGAQGSMALDSLSNAGIVQGTAGLDIGVRGDADNVDGGVLATFDPASTPMALRVGGALRNEGIVQSAGALDLAASGNLVNGGTVASGGAARIVGATLDNRKLIQSGNDMTVTVGASVANAAGGNLLSGGALAVSGSGAVFDVDNYGRLQAAGHVTVGGTIARARLVNRAAGILVGGATNLAAVTLDNAGIVQGTSLYVTTSGMLTNRSGARLLVDGSGGGSFTFYGQAFTNDGIAQSTGALALTVNSFTNTGTLVTVPAAGGGVAVNAADSFGNSGTLASNGGLAIVAGRLTNTGSLSALGAGSVMVNTSFVNDSKARLASKGNLSVQSQSGAFTLTNAGTIESDGQLLVGGPTARVALVNNGNIVGRSVGMTGSTLDNVGKDARILSALGSGGGVDLVFDGALANAGALHADGKLDVTARAITNTSSGGISAIGDLGMTAAGGDLRNDGWLFSLRDMRLTATGHQIKNSVTGNIEATTAPHGNIAFDTGTTGSFVNNNYINAAGKLKIVTGNFTNQSGDKLPTLSYGPEVYTGENPDLLGDSGDFNCDGVSGSYYNCAHSRVHQYNYYRDEVYSFDPGQLRRALLLSTGDVDITYHGTAANTFALISGRNVSIRGADKAAPFENNDLHLHRQTLIKVEWNRSDHDENRYPTTDAHYDELPPSGAPEEAWEEAPADWAHYGNASASPEEVRDSGLIHPKVTGTKAKPDQPSFGAGIYAQEKFDVTGAIRLTGMPSTGGGKTAPGVSGTVAAIASAPGTTSAAPGTLVPVNGGSAGGDSILPPGARIGGIAVLSGMAPARHVTPDGLTRVLVGDKITGIATAVGANGVPFVGPNLALPANPNGLFIVAPANDTRYLIETNPLFGADGAVGSNFLAQRLGYDPDVLGKRLGDANYETRLVRDQLVAQTNNFLLAGYSREADQMKGLMDNAASQAGVLGLTLGEPLTAEQAGKLTDDLVWMVAASVNGQTVLAPVVYLSATTRDSVLNGSVIAARDVHIDGDTVSNTGSTIAATNGLDIRTTGDLTNTGGTLRANTVALTSTAGSVVNQTSATFYGNDTYGRTSIGPTGTIVAGSDLAINAAKDVRVTGASVTAGRNAAIEAGSDVVFDTIEDKRADTSAGSSGNANNGRVWSHNEVDTRQIGSTVSAGGNLTVRSGNDVMVAGSTVKAGGNVGVDARHDVKVVDRQDVHAVTDSTRTTSSGLTAKGSAVGYAVSNTSETTKTRTGTGVASSIEAGGNASLVAGETVTVRGSDVAATGELAVNAKNVEVLAGQNTFEQTIDKKSSTTGVSVGVDIKAVTSVIDMAHGKKPSAADVARLAADAYGNKGVTVGLESSTTTTHSRQSDSTARVSSLASGGKTSVTAHDTATFEGAQVKAGGDIDVQGRDIRMVEARNTTSFTSQSETTGLSISASVDPSAIARKAAADNVHAGGGGGVNLANVTNTRQDVTDTTDKGVLGTFTAGGNMTRTATGTITDQGSQITVAKDFTQAAGTIDMLAATDRTVHEDDKTTNKGSIGFSIGFEPKKAAEDAKGGNPMSAIGLIGGPTAGVDVNYTRKVESNDKETTTARVGNIVAGGKLASTSTGTTTMQGTNLLAGGDTVIKASSLEAQAARNTTTRSGNENTLSVDARAEVDVKGAPSGSLSAGYATKKTDGATSNAVTGMIGAGGNLTVTTTKGDATFEGTQLMAGKDVIVDAAGAVDMKAANSTSSSSEDRWNVKAGAGTSKGGGKSVNAGGGFSKSSSDSSTAQAGSVLAGNDVSIVARKDVTLEGTALGAGHDATVSTDGNVKLLAAQSNSSSDNISVDARIGGSRSPKSQSGKGQVGVEVGNTRSRTEIGSDIAVGNELTLHAGGTMLMQGTQVDAGKKAETAANGGLTRQDATSTSSSDGVKVFAYVQGSSKRGGGDNAATNEPTRPRANAVTEQDTRPRSDALSEQGTRPRANAVTEAPATAPTEGSGGGASTSTAGKLEGAYDKANALRKQDGALATGKVTHSSDSASTAVAIREGAAATVPPVLAPKMAALTALPVVKTAAQVNTALAGARDKYGSEAAIPAEVKREVLVKAGVAVAPGADVDALLKQTRSAGTTAAVAGLASARLDAAQQAAALKSMGVGP